jgi:DNA-binding NarL/FixJ family response regulator
VSARPTIVLVDKHPVTRLGASRVLTRNGFQVLGEAGDREGAMELVARERPDICLLDLYLPGGAIDAIASLTQIAPETVVVVLTDAVNPEDMLAAVRAGARGYLTKDTPPDRLARALHGVLKGEAALSRVLVGHLLDELRELPAAESAPLRIDGVQLSPRESEVLRLLRSGLSTVEISERLSLSPVTVRRHISAGVARLGAAGRDDLIRASA